MGGTRPKMLCAEHFQESHWLECQLHAMVKLGQHLATFKRRRKAIGQPVSEQEENLIRQAFICVLRAPIPEAYQKALDELPDVFGQDLLASRKDSLTAKQALFQAWTTDDKLAIVSTALDQCMKFLNRKQDNMQTFHGPESGLATMNAWAITRNCWRFLKGAKCAGLSPLELAGANLLGIPWMQLVNLTLAAGVLMQVTTVGAVDDFDPVVSLGNHAQVNDPEVSQTGSKHQPGQAFRVREVALVQVEATAFLVGEEGFDAEALGVPVAGFFDQGHVGDQVEGLFVALFPPGNDQHGAIGLAGEGDIKQPDTLVWLHVHLLQRELVAVVLNLRVLGRAVDVLPAIGLAAGLKDDAIELTVTQKDDSRALGQQAIHLGSQLHARLLRKMAFAASYHNPSHR
jgi:hypothetical protein